MLAARRHRRAKPLRTIGLPATPLARRPAARLVNQRKPGLEVHSPLAEVRPLYRHAFSTVGKGAVKVDLDGNNDYRSSQGHQHKFTEICLAVTFQAAGDVLQLSSTEPAKLVESVLGYAGKAEDVAIKPLGSAGSWQVCCRIGLQLDPSRDRSFILPSLFLLWYLTDPLHASHRGPRGPRGLISLSI